MRKRTQTSEIQTSMFGEDLSTSSQEASLVSPTATQGSEEEKTTNAICGPKCLEQFGRFNRHGSWAKTFAGLLIGMEGWSSTRCKLIWKLKGTKSHRMYFLLAGLTHRTEGSESGLLLTPTATMIPLTENRMESRTKYRASIGRKYVPGNLAEQIGAIGLLCTPTAQSSRGNTNDARGKGNLTDQIAELIQQETGKPSQINPLFVGEMMGFPENWTVLPFHSGKQNQLKDLETQ